MGELLATILYLLSIEQWPSNGSKEDIDMGGSTSSTSSFVKVNEESDSDDGSYVYVESFIHIQTDESYMDRDAFLRLTPFAGGAGKYSEYVLSLRDWFECMWCRCGEVTSM